MMVPEVYSGLGYYKESNYYSTKSWLVIGRLDLFTLEKKIA